MSKYISKLNDTIIALSTPIGKSSIGVIRISGNKVENIINIFFNKKNIKERFAYFVNIINPYNNEILDNGILIFFKKPNSFTGEDVLEFSGHGNPIILNKIINIIILKTNIRLAFRGEFSNRALINDKLNLVQVENLLSLINSESEISYKILLKSIDKNILFNKIKKIIKSINDLIILIEACLNFSNEDINFNLNNKIFFLKDKIINDLKKIINNFNYINVLKNGINISIIGKPNVGKSTLFNSLINEDKSIVSSISGTTRDSINKEFIFNGKFFNISDTAGITNTNNELEIFGINKTINQIYKSDFIFYVVDNNNDIKNIKKYIKMQLLKFKFNYKKLFEIPFVIIKNKIDLYNEKPKIIKKKKYEIIYISSKNNIGINLIKNNIFYKKLNFTDNINNKYFINDRQNEIIIKSLSILNKINFYDFILFLNDIKEVNKLLNKIIYYKYNSKNILDNIFSKFCIGK